MKNVYLKLVGLLKYIMQSCWKLKYKRFLDENSTHTQLLLSNIFRDSKSSGKLLFEYGFRIFSQHEEDGILLYIFSLIGHTNKKCIEMCCGNGMESNTANLIVNHFWTGLLFDGNEKNVANADKFYRFHHNTRIFPPKIVKAWITAENINALIAEGGFSGEIDLFSLDVDGIDCYLMQKLEAVNPRVIVVEINHLLGFEKSLSIPYHPEFVAEFSADGTDYAGASIMAFIKLLRARNYRFIGTNRFATNAFFLRNDVVCKELVEVSDVGIYFKHDRVIYGMTERFKRVAAKEWIEV